MVSSQQQANISLRKWQMYRDLTPNERLEKLLADFFAPPAETKAEYEITLTRVSEAVQEPRPIDPGVALGWLGSLSFMVAVWGVIGWEIFRP